MLSLSHGDICGGIISWTESHQLGKPGHTNSSMSFRSHGHCEDVKSQHVESNETACHGRPQRKPSLEGGLAIIALLISIALATACQTRLAAAYSPQRSHHASAAARRPTTATISCHPADNDTAPKDCIFDEMLNGWVPPACYNSLLAHEALRNDTLLALHGGAGPFPWWRDENHTVPLPGSELEAHVLSTDGALKAYTWEKWHVAHCLYVWRLSREIIQKIADGSSGEVWVDERVLEEEHVYHCNNVIANQDHRVGARAVVHFGFHKCVRVAG